MRRATDTDLTVLARFGFALNLGSSSLMLSASPHNAAARQLFERPGLRPTMIEMWIELGGVKQELPLTDDAEIERLVRDFEALTLPRANWTHRAHLAVGVYYLRHRGLDGALQQMRERLQAYNLACGDPDGYSETITTTYLETIAAEISGDGRAVTMAEQVARLEKRFPSWRTPPPRPPSTC